MAVLFAYWLNYDQELQTKLNNISHEKCKNYMIACELPYLNCSAEVLDKYFGKESDLLISQQDTDLGG